MAQAEEALLHRPCTAKVPVDSTMFCIRPGPLVSQAHLSPFSPEPPLEAVQPVMGTGSVTASPYSWPATMLTASSAPAEPPLTTLAGQVNGASVMYGMWAKAPQRPGMSWTAVCQAQNSTPKPAVERPVAVKIM